MVENKTLGIAVVLILIVGGGLWYANDQGFINTSGQATITPSQTTTTTTTSTTGQVQTQTGDFIIKTALIDTKDQTTTRTDGTNINVLFYQLKNGEYQWKGTSSSNSATIGLDETLVEVQAMLEIPDAQAFFVDLVKTQGQTSRIGNAVWADPDKDNTLDPVIPLNIVGITPQGQDDPTLNWTVFMLVDDGTNIDLDDPSNLDTDNLGTGKQDCAIDWNLQLSANARGGLLKKFDITINGTDEGRIVPNESYVDVIHDHGTDRIKLTNGDVFKNVDNSNSQIVYEYQFGDGEVADGRLFSIDANQSILKKSMPVNIKTNFGASDNAINVTLGVTFMDAQGESYTENTDLVICAKA
ncbi:MAG: hypothetical protein K5790_10190 [Nitrosopumilus sp.]|uniref:hypothetical protein n=1 Tax=Nitrosopumilus sp. TaxID=2024843 RepID=UPI00247BA658|nr:hypothetical protein [Nitrosopumilus sp.]MCV0393638.1 hypothetical protein [Nitrosopumilus sp.]